MLVAMEIGDGYTASLSFRFRLFRFEVEIREGCFDYLVMLFKDFLNESNSLSYNFTLFKYESVFYH